MNKLSLFPMTDEFQRSYSANCNESVGSQLRAVLVMGIIEFNLLLNGCISEGTSLLVLSTSFKIVLPRELLSR